VTERFKNGEGFRFLVHRGQLEALLAAVPTEQRFWVSLENVNGSVGLCMEAGDRYPADAAVALEARTAMQQLPSVDEVVIKGA